MDGVDTYDSGDNVTGEAVQQVNAVDCTLTSTKYGFVVSCYTGLTCRISGLICIFYLLC